MIGDSGGKSHAPRSLSTGGPLTWKFSTKPTQAATSFSQLPSWASPFVAQGSSPREVKPRALPPPQKSAAPGTAVIAQAVSHSAGAATSVPSVTGLTAPSRASLPLATAALALAHPLKAGSADQPSLASPVSSSSTLPLACCSLPPKSSPLPRSGPSSAVLRPSLPSLDLTPRSSPTRPPAWPPTTFSGSSLTNQVLTARFRTTPTPFSCLP